MRLLIVVWLAVVCSSAALTADLTVRVTNVQGRDGVIVARLYADAKGFPSDPQTAAAEARVEAAATVSLSMRGLTPGRFALVVIHDRNGDGVMEKTFLGLPEEGYGLSNNPRPLLVPRFDDARFELKDGQNQIEVALVYY
jgi:uncharacterized protein (DUF2141 family)